MAGSWALWEQVQLVELKLGATYSYTLGWLSTIIKFERCLALKQGRLWATALYSKSGNLKMCDCPLDSKHGSSL